MNRSDINNAKRAPNCRQITFIFVVERTWWLIPLNTPSDHTCYIAALLHSNGRETGKQFPILLEVSGIADDKHVRVPRNAQVGFDLDTSCSILRRSNPVSSIGSFHPSRPYNHVCAESLIS